MFTVYQALFQSSAVCVTVINIQNDYLSFCSFNDPADTMYQYFLVLLLRFTYNPRHYK